MNPHLTIRPTAEPVDLAYFLRHTKVQAGAEVTLVLGTVLAGNTITINGLLFTAHATVTTVATRQFSIAGATATLDAVELVTCINHANYGVPGLVASSVGNTITLRSADGSTAITVTLPASTITVVTSDEQADCQAKLTAAIRTVELACGRDRLLESTWEMRLQGFPCCGYIELPLPQVSSIASITYLDTLGVTNTMPSTDYRLDGDYRPVTLDTTGINDQVTFSAQVTLKYGKSWPSATLENGEAVVITFVAGWRAAANVPEALKAAICLRAAHLYRNRESVTVGRDTTLSSELALGELDLIRPYRSASMARPW